MTTYLWVKVAGIAVLLVYAFIGGVIQGVREGR